MESGLARFVVLIVLFFLMTGDLAGLIKHMFEGTGGKQPRTESTKTTATDKSLDGEGIADPDMESFGKLYNIVQAIFCRGTLFGKKIVIQTYHRSFMNKGYLRTSVFFCGCKKYGSPI